jgi:hypothetical protein
LPWSKSCWCLFDPSIVRVAKNGMYMMLLPYLSTGGSGAHFHRKAVRQHIHRFLISDVACEDEPYNSGFLRLNAPISCLVKE